MGEIKAAAHCGRRAATVDLRSSSFVLKCLYLVIRYASVTAFSAEV